MVVRDAAEVVFAVRIVVVNTSARGGASADHEGDAGPSAGRSRRRSPGGRGP